MRYNSFGTSIFGLLITCSKRILILVNGKTMFHNFNLRLYFT